MMTFNALMLPTLPPTPAAGLKASGNFGPTALKSSRPSESTEGNRSFLATLNQVSHRQRLSRPESTCTKDAANVSADSGKVTPDCGKTNNATSDSPNRAEETGTTPSAEVTPKPDPRQSFGMIHLRLFDFLIAADGSFSNETLSETAGESGLGLLDNLTGYFRPQDQGSLIDWLTGIGPFEQLQANISPEAGNRNFFEQLVAKAAIDQSTGQIAGGMLDSQAGFNGFWHWLTTSSPEETLNSPAASVWVNGDTLLAALLHMQQTVAAGSGLNVDIGGTAGEDAAASLATIIFNEDLLLKMTIPSVPGESDLTGNAKLAENIKMAPAGKDTPIPLWAAADPSSETLLETPARQVTENSQLFKMAADAKPAAEQSADPNIVTGGATTQPAGHDSGSKSAVLKTESLPLAEFGNKIIRIEADNKDSSFFFAQDQMPEHLKALESATRTLEGARSGLTSQAMEQIVHKAVLLLNNGQHEVHIELKPEFLGHIRMQIVTENQQVTIKITAELPFVKDMLESNLNQLKAELQAQGLKIDSLEVSVGHDSYAEGDTHQAAEVAKVQAVTSDTDLDDEWPDKSMQSQTQGGGPMAETGIDYFA